MAGEPVAGARTLYEFQQEGVDYLLQDKPWGKGYRGGFLWDDPGLGKTTQAIEAAHRIGEYPILVVCPNALKSHWRREIRAMIPDAKVSVATVGGRLRKYSQTYGKLLELPPSESVLQELGADWIIVHYAGLRVSQNAYREVPWATVIADECHYVKNRNARRTEALMDITPDKANRIGLTATPWSKEPSGLWAQMFWMAPQVEGLSNYWRWFGLFVDFVMEEIRDKKTGKVIRKYRKVIGGKNLDALAEVMSHYGLCRTKKQVAPQLPPITDTKMPLELSGRQEAIYEALADKSRAELAIRKTGGEDTGGVAKMVIKNVLSRLTKMERWLSNPGEIDPGVKGAKMEWLESWAADFPYPAVIVTRFKSTARMVAQHLGVEVITGDVPIKARDRIIEKWRANDASSPQFLVGTIHTIGTGLNLERAYSLVCFDQVHSSILMTQVRERVHRITSDHPVEVIYLVIEDTSNELVYKSFRNKWRTLELVKQFLRMLREGRGEKVEVANGGT